MKTFKEMREACWAGYKAVGLKKKGGKMVPNCVPEDVTSDDDYKAKKKALQDIQNDPKQAAIVGRDKLVQRKDKLDKDYQDFKNKNTRNLAASTLRYSVKFAMQKGGKIANAFYKDKEEAEKFVKSVIAKGGKAIMTTEEVKEDAPANAVGDGSAVAMPPAHEPGVSVKKKKKC